MAGSEAGASLLAERSLARLLAERAVHVRDAAKCIGKAIVKLECPRAALVLARSDDPAFVLFARSLALHLLDVPAFCPRPSPAARAAAAAVASATARVSSSPQPSPQQSPQQSPQRSDDPGLAVFLEPRILNHPLFQRQRIEAARPAAARKLRPWTLTDPHAQTHPRLTDSVDFIITLGGDGTVLYAAWLFQNSQVPPVIPFHLGSLGFLTVFHISDIREVLARALGCSGDGVRVNMRMRLACSVFRASQKQSKKESLSLPPPAISHASNPSASTHSDSTAQTDPIVAATIDAFSAISLSDIHVTSFSDSTDLDSSFSSAQTHLSNATQSTLHHISEKPSKETTQQINNQEHSTIIDENSLKSSQRFTSESELMHLRDNDGVVSFTDPSSTNHTENDHDEEEQNISRRRHKDHSDHRRAGQNRGWRGTTTNFMSASSSSTRKRGQNHSQTNVSSAMSLRQMARQAIALALARDESVRKKTRPIHLVLHKSQTKHDSVNPTTTSISALNDETNSMNKQTSSVSGAVPTALLKSPITSPFTTSFMAAASGDGLLSPASSNHDAAGSTFNCQSETTSKSAQSTKDDETNTSGLTQPGENDASVEQEEATFHILNDLVVDRGPSPYMSQLELYVDDVHLTTVQADGLVVSTPTGSTAYSLSAGGSLVHPEVPSFLLTPICAHTLSFRPMLLPDTIELKIQVPETSRTTAWASFDGRHRLELLQGDCIRVTMSRYPMPSVCLQDQSSDWFESLRRCLHWNERARQKPFFGVPDDMKRVYALANEMNKHEEDGDGLEKVSLEEMANTLFGHR